jgi:hypothetical protein
MKLVLNNIIYKNNGKTIFYDYDITSDISKYFNLKDPFYITYQQDISKTPESINVIPLLANIMPIAWFVGFDVYIDELDETFYNSLNELKDEFTKHFSQIKTDKQFLYVRNLVKNNIVGNETALLFSGGLDAFEALTRNIEKNPYLISVHGADIEIEDSNRWNDFLKYNDEEKIINKDRICYVESNVREFYTYDVDLLVNVGWWGKIQHGMSLVGLIAPISKMYNITTVLIASSNTGEVSFGWGSTQETDEKIRWANLNTIHDGFHLRRTQKIENIILFANKTGHKVKLRVCYSELRNGYNCNRCPKCQRTMFGFMLEGVNPNEFGFNVPKDFYDLLLKNFSKNTIMTDGIRYEWLCLQDKAKIITKPYIIENEMEELLRFNNFMNLDLNEMINKNHKNLMEKHKMKFILMKKFPNLFQMYLNIRRKL